MDKVATSPTPPRGAGQEAPSIDELIKSGSLHQRLAAARAARAKALAQIGEQPEQFLSGLKPWERPEYVRGEPRRGLGSRPVPDRPAASSPARPAPLVLSAPAASRAGTVVAPQVQAVALRPQRTRQLRLLQVAGGAIFGIAVGAGLGYWFANTTPPGAATPFAPIAEAPVPPGRDGAAENAAIALPATDTVPATPDAPHLSNVTSVAALLPTIATNGPIRRDAILAPQLAGLPQAGESAILAPAVVFAPQQPRDRGDLGHPAAAEELRLAARAAPGRVAIAGLDAALTPPDAAMPALPVAPGVVTAPAAWHMPDSAPVTATPGDTPLAVQGLPLPVSRAAPAAGLTLILHAPARLSGGEVGSVEDRLRAGGFGDAELRPTDLTISRSNVRYFSPADAAAAKAVATALNADLRDFTSFSPRPPAGTLEIWLAGQGSGATRSAANKAPAKTRNARPATVSAVEALKNRLVRQLRAGTLN